MITGWHLAVLALFSLMVGPSAGAQQAKKLGIKPKDINRLVHEYRKSRKT